MTHIRGQTRLLHNNTEQARIAADIRVDDSSYELLISGYRDEATVLCLLVLLSEVSRGINLHSPMGSNLYPSQQLNL
jgi:hypothetical protein